MSSDQPRSPRFTSVLVLSIVCLTSSACADSMPAVDTSQNTRAEDEATAKAVRKSAEAGNASAQYSLGLLYAGGVGVPQDDGQAKGWFEQAAKQGHVGAQVDLGTLYLQGAGPRKAPRWRCSGLVRRQSTAMGWRVRNWAGCMQRGTECSRTLSRPTCGTASRQHEESRAPQRLVMRSLTR
jgi:hypothetical protein